MLEFNKLSAHRSPDTEATITRRSTMRCAASVGPGDDAVDIDQFRFPLRGRLAAVPSAMTTLAMPYGCLCKADAGSSGRSVHAGTGFRLHAPLPVEVGFPSVKSVGEILDKGAGRAVIVSRQRKRHARSAGRLLAEIRGTDMFRADAGFDRPGAPTARSRKNPARAPDAAPKRGFPRPILHRFATFGMTFHARPRRIRDRDPRKLWPMSARSSRPPCSGQTIAIVVAPTAAAASPKTDSAK